MVKVGKLWGDARFASLSSLSKLLYCYLVSQPSISTLGVLHLDRNRVGFDIGYIPHEEEEFETIFKELYNRGYIKYFFKDEGYIKVVVLDHFKNLPKSKATLRKAIDEGKKADEDLVEILRSVFSSKDFSDSFTPPTAQEVADYALSLGFLVNGKDFVEYYGDNDWYDKNNKKVRNWKAKCRKVWCRDTNKLKTVEGAPKGFEYFFVEIEEGNRIYPTAWVNDLPTHSNHIYAEYLIEEYNDRRS